MSVKMILWLILIIPWITLFFLKKREIKRFMPVGILASFIMVLYNLVAYNHQHWKINVSIIPSLNPAFVSGVLGAFLVVTIWIFTYSFGHFWKYLLVNIVADFMFAVFPFHYLLQEKLQIYQLVTISPWERWGLFVAISVVIYGYQVWQEEGLEPITQDEYKD
ncbi:hypothetical protein [Rossellomorea aquimaris]|uniref:hypothetical protein n=1 Tax=Rossellomorea aquimaris TaxID=189382 RepID=UPI000B021B04|nr:hypothetical protein [Rossellomorea aquimaris]